jgi:hypothetical protein
MQAPLPQTWPPEQDSPQPLQFRASVREFTHAPAHKVSPFEQTAVQAPIEQTSWALQIRPQAPQFLGSLCGSTHAVPHRVPAAQTHCPSVQIRSALQVTKQAPQLFALTLSATQALPQAVNPASQLAVQIPWSQTSMVLQAFPQPPQLVGSLASITHRPPQES